MNIQLKNHREYDIYIQSLIDHKTLMNRELDNMIEHFKNMKEFSETAEKVSKNETLYPLK